MLWLLVLLLLLLLLREFSWVSTACCYLLNYRDSPDVLLRFAVVARQPLSNARAAWPIAVALGLDRRHEEEVSRPDETEIEVC